METPLAACSPSIRPASWATARCQRIHDQVMEDALHEDAPPVAVSVASGAIDAVRQLHRADGRERDIGFAVRLPHPAEDIFHAFAAPLAFNQDAGIEDQAQGSVPCRRVAGLAVADDLFQIGGEAGVHHRLVAQLFGARLGQRDGLGDATGAAAPRARRTADGCVPLSMTTSTPARTRAIRPAKSRAASSSEMWITWSAMARLYRHPFSWFSSSASKRTRTAPPC